MTHPVVEHLKNLVPLCEIKDDNFIELVRHTVIGSSPAGQTLFEQDEPDEYSYYLLTGQLTMRNSTGITITVTAGQPECRYPLDQHNPRKFTAIADTPIKYIKINKNILDVLLAWNQTTGYVVTEIDDTSGQDQDNDWMFNILRSHLFQRIPAANIQAMFLRFRPEQYQQGDTIIQQNETADDYFVIKSGRCGVYRTGDDKQNELLAEIGPGDGFGEEALLTDTKRNATVIMLEAGEVMRLSRQDFDTLLKEPAIKAVTYAEACELVLDGAMWLDVRLEDEHSNHSLPDSLHIPLSLLRVKREVLNKDLQYIVYCDTGRRSAAAAYLMSQKGFNALLLEGGLAKIPSKNKE
ncbi:MAG: cyclic nucleotide-binding domain-containing protein [Gammaproteobacteria bacterium]|nr:cyclic nucleotide-binding domain-containing protein [Gammaproteobacteria bacterium]MDH5652690.1 cyclic nucleotide-binding domain-containing protein [Gammaproteobacteria bacterium]